MNFITIAGMVVKVIVVLITLILPDDPNYFIYLSISSLFLDKICPPSVWRVEIVFLFKHANNACITYFRAIPLVFL